MSEVLGDPQAAIRCVHVDECGACPLMRQPYAEQCEAKRERLDEALGRYGIEPSTPLGPVVSAEPITGYRRRAKLVVARRRGADPTGVDRGGAAATVSAQADGEVAIGLYQRQDNQRVVDISECLVLSPGLRQIVDELRRLAADPPQELACLLEPVHDGGGVLMGLDARELSAPDGSSAEDSSVLLTLVIAADRARPTEELREAGSKLIERLPRVSGLAASLRQPARHQSSSDFVVLAGQSEARDALGEGYQLVSHTSFLHVHQGQAERLYGSLAELVGRLTRGAKGRVLDLYGGTGAIALGLARAGHTLTLVESYPPAASLASRAAQAQRLPMEVVTGDVASVTKVLAGAGGAFDVVVANPPRRGLSPAAREALASLAPPALIYVACDLDNLSRDLDHLSRLGFRLEQLELLDMLPLTEEIEVVALLLQAGLPVPAVLHEDDGLVALDKPPHEPCTAKPEYPSSLVDRARASFDGGDWLPVLDVEAGTSGVCFFARDQAAQERWAASLERTGRLVFLAAARGVTPAKGAITRDLRGAEGMRSARTRYRRLAIGGGHSVLRVVPERYQYHQIRRHLAAIGHPVLGDARYGHGPTNRYFEEKHGLDRSFLHLVRVEIDHPTTGERLLIESPLSADLRAALTRASDESVLRFLENKKALGGPPRRRPPDWVPPSERSPLSVVEELGPESAYPIEQAVSSQRGDLPELDEAPRTVRGELLTPDED